MIAIFTNFLRKEAWKKFRTSTGFEPVTSRYRCDALPTEYEATDVESRSISRERYVDTLLEFSVFRAYAEFKTPRKTF